MERYTFMIYTTSIQYFHQPLKLNKNKQEQSLKIFKIADFYPSHLVTSKVKWRSVKLLLPTACSAADSQ